MAQTLGASNFTFDYLGTLLFAVMSFCGLFALNRLNDEGWQSAVVLAPAATAVLSAPMLAYVEVRVANPVLPVWLFCGQVRFTTLFTQSASWSVYDSSFQLIALYLQYANCLHQGVIGRLMVVRPIMAAIMSVVMSSLIRKKTYNLPRLSQLGTLGVLVSYVMVVIMGRTVCLISMVEWCHHG